MRTRRAVLFKEGQEPFYCEVGCPDSDNFPFQYVIRVDELYRREELRDLHDELAGRICASSYRPQYEI